MTKNFVSDALRKGLNKRPGKAMLAALFAVSTAVFFVFARYARYALIDEFSGDATAELAMITAAAYTVIFALSYAIQLRVGRKLPVYMHVLTAFLTGLVILAKISLLDYVSDDYDIFLSDWIYDYSQMSLKLGLGWYLQSDYTPPYLYMLQLISRIDSYPRQYMV